jgi:protein-S-isoprenylcysteine O-methyltransferase Ste14
MTFFDYFQLASLAAYAAVFVGRSILLQAHGTRVFVLGAGKKGAGAWLERSFMAVLLLWMAQIVAYALHLPPFLPAVLHEPMFVSTAAQAAGALLSAAGLVFFVAALGSFGRSWRIGIDTGKPGALVTGGAFSISRNPVFLFMDAYFVGTFLICSSPFFLACAAIAVAGIHWQILQEERFLAQHYGAGYMTYRAAVRRYI